MIWNHLVDIAVLVSLALRMANHDDHLRPVSHPSVNVLLWFAPTRGLPILMCR